MVVRVKLKLRGNKRMLAVRAVVNSGFETREVELILPPRFAEPLGTPTKIIEDLEVAGGGRILGYRLKGMLEVELPLGKGKSVKTKAVATVLPGEREVIIGDRLASALGIVILDPYRGIWCLRSELGRSQRSSG